MSAATDPDSPASASASSASTLTQSARLQRTIALVTLTFICLVYPTIVESPITRASAIWLVIRAAFCVVTITGSKSISLLLLFSTHLWMVVVANILRYEVVASTTSITEEVMMILERGSSTILSILFGIMVFWCAALVQLPDEEMAQWWLDLRELSIRPHTGSVPPSRAPRNPPLPLTANERSSQGRSKD
ncbi:hypothetical protein DFH06DRAFT_1126669 [Mycena polygramma]|nr:hypothetical protein DFH06DRAFT_1126669 [Mycena polygramma]